MKVETITTHRGVTRYILIDDSGGVVEAAMKFIRYKDNCGSARNTLKAYCHHLKAYFEFLEQKGLSIFDVGIDEMAQFVHWLHSPSQDVRVIHLGDCIPKRKARTVNMYLSTVLGFYDYLARNDAYSGKLQDRLRKQISGAHRGFRDFLYHINRNRTFLAKSIKLKEPPLRPKTLTKEQVETIQLACNNIRDKFLIQLLWESGMRIGEALCLWLEDFELDARKIHIRDRQELVNLAEIKTVGSPRSLDVTAELMNLCSEYIALVHTDEVDTNHVFIKLAGGKRGLPMEYADVISLVKRLRRKTGIEFTPHMLRHTSFTTLSRSGWPAERLRLRAGHRNVQSTYIYLHPSDEDMRDEWEKTEQNMRLKKEEGK